MSLVVVEGSNGSGKTEIIKKLTEQFNIVGKKSIPNWYRSSIEFARRCSLDLQKVIYLYGHYINYLECNDEQDYIFDRYIYSTIIRINYGLKKSKSETINEILSYEYKPNLVIVLKSDKKIIRERLNIRRDFTFDEDFYDYENEIYEQLALISDIIFIVNNNSDINSIIYEVSKIIVQNTNVRKKVNYVRRI